MSETSPRKLAGWKGIADYLNTSVRTAQRWERELGLPVHHVGGSKGYTVVADGGELDDWLKGRDGRVMSSNDVLPGAASTPSEAQGRRWLPWAWVIAAMVLLVSGSIFAIVRFLYAPSPKVGLITFSGQQMLAWSKGKVVWYHDFGQPTRSLVPDDVGRTMFRIRPSHGGKGGEVIVVAPLWRPEAGDLSTDAVYCFSPEGNLLWRHVFTDRVHFGGEECGPRWEVGDLFATGTGANWSVWCAVCSQPTSVAMIVKIDSSGNPTRYFVNYGHLRRLNELHVPGGPYILAGGTNNESNNGAVAVLDEARPSGHSPQTGTLSDCDSCPQGQPFRYFLFPRSEVIRVTGPPYNSVEGVAVTDGRTQVKTSESRSADLGVWALYELSAELLPRSVVFSDHYWFTHEQLSAENKIKHSVAACPERLKPVTVREWTPQEGWKDIPVPPSISTISSGVANPKTAAATAEAPSFAP